MPPLAFAHRYNWVDIPAKRPYVRKTPAYGKHLLKYDFRVMNIFLTSDFGITWSNRTDNLFIGRLDTNMNIIILLPFGGICVR